MNNLNLINQIKEAGVDTQLYTPLTPRQQRFMELYLDVDSKTFGNCYQSAIGAGFTDQTARNLTHNKPKWYSELIGQNSGIQPEHLLLKLTDIINDSSETTQNKLRAIDMLMKHKSMYPTPSRTLNFNRINIQSVLD
ncbi:MAG TPA: hypothetical protein VLG09_01460 [Candidatus Saccharimonadales bacterium]|nr:hypothetical protein [Candidatus Saccharimonadales bacterium]